MPPNSAAERNSKTLRSSKAESPKSASENETRISPYQIRLEPAQSPPRFPGHSAPNPPAPCTPLPTPARTGSRQQLTSTLTSQSTLPRPPRGGAPASTMCAAAARSAPPLPFTAPPATPRPRASASSSRAKIPTPPRLHARASPRRAAPPGAVGPPRLLEAPTAGPAPRARAQPPPRLARRPAAAADRGRPERLGFGVAPRGAARPTRRGSGGRRRRGGEERCAGVVVDLVGTAATSSRGSSEEVGEKGSQSQRPGASQHSREILLNR